MSENEELIPAEAEAKEPEAKVENKNQKNTNEPVELTKITAEEKPYSEVVEEERLKLFKDSKKQSTLSIVSMGIVFVILAAGFFLFTINQLAAYITVGAAVVVLIVFSIIVKRICSPDTKKYISTASTAINRYIFNDTEYQECIYDPNAKIVFGEIAEDGVYDKMKECVSRDVVTGKFKGRTFKAAELGIYQEMIKRTKPTAFVGKYLTFPNDLHFVGRIVIVSKGKEDIDIPGGIGDLNIIKEEGRFGIYAENAKVVSDVLPKKFLDAIEKIKIDQHLLTLTFVIWAGRTVVYASYDDAAVTLPFQNKIDVTCYEQYRSNVRDELDALYMLIGE